MSDQSGKIERIEGLPCINRNTHTLAVKTRKCPLRSNPVQFQKGFPIHPLFNISCLILVVPILLCAQDEQTTDENFGLLSN